MLILASRNNLPGFLGIGNNFGSLTSLISGNARYLSKIENHDDASYEGVRH